MKKCASCTKDLPDAALHCVFCGAKQPPAPASQPAMARTVMGYGNDELDKLREQATLANAARKSTPSVPPVNLQVATGFDATAPAPAITSPRAHNPSQPPPVSGYAPGALAPVAGVNAATMFADGPPPGAAPRAHSPSQVPAAPSVKPSAGAYNIGTPQPSPYAPSSPAYPAQVPATPATQVLPPPYLAPGAAARTLRPVEPWKNALRTQMFLWGALLLIAFAVPLTLEPLTGNWDTVLHGAGSAKLLPLILAAVGFLAIVVGSIPMEPGARGMIALLLGLAGIAVPIALAVVNAPEGVNAADWHRLVPLVGILLLVPGLLIRAHYRDSIAPRIMVTLGALAVLVPYVVPVGGNVPLVGAIQATFSGEVGLASVLDFALYAFPVVLCVLSLLVWLPAPATGGASLIAWLFILFPLITHAAMLFLHGDPSQITATPNAALVGWVDGSGYLAIFSYGLASVVGKQLE